MFILDGLYLVLFGLLPEVLLLIDYVGDIGLVVLGPFGFLCFKGLRDLWLFGAMKGLELAIKSQFIFILIVSFELLYLWALF